MRGLAETLKHLFHPRRSNNHRPHLLHPQAFLALSICAISFAILLQSSSVNFFLARTGQVLGFSSSITAGDVVSRTNAERARLGLSALTTNSLLNQAAVAKAQHMISHQYWAHIAPDGTDPWSFFKQANYRYSVAGENLARDFAESGDMMSAWMASPTHRANIVNPRYQEIGVAVVDGKLLGTETTLVVQLFGTPATTTTAVPAKAAQTAPRTEVVPAPQAAQTLTLIEAPPPTSAQPQPVELAAGGVNGPGITRPQILGSGLFPLSQLHNSPIFSPLQLMKLFFLAMIFLIVLTLSYDAVIMSQRNTVRMVGKNFAHIILFIMVAYLLIFFRGGVIG